MYLAVVDSGLDYVHPVFGGSRLIATTALTLDDFGHGTYASLLP